MSVFEVIWRPGNPGTNHIAIELRRADDWESEFKLQGFLTLRKEDLDYFIKRIADPKRIRLTKGHKPHGMGKKKETPFGNSHTR